MTDMEKTTDKANAGMVERAPLRAPVAADVVLTRAERQGADDMLGALIAQWRGVEHSFAERLPWSFSTIRLPWMAAPLLVHWR
jgi:hypothetical protein